MKTVVGAGIISLPSTIGKLGYLFGLFVYLMVLAINQFTSVMLVIFSQNVHTETKA